MDTSIFLHAFRYIQRTMTASLCSQPKREHPNSGLRERERERESMSSFSCAVCSVFLWGVGDKIPSGSLGHPETTRKGTSVATSIENRRRKATGKRGPWARIFGNHFPTAAQFWDHFVLHTYIHIYIYNSPKGNPFVAAISTFALARCRKDGTWFSVTYDEAALGDRHRRISTEVEASFIGGCWRGGWHRAAC